MLAVSNILQLRGCVTGSLATPVHCKQPLLLPKVYSAQALVALQDKQPTQVIERLSVQVSAPRSRRLHPCRQTEASPRRHQGDRRKTASHHTPELVGAAEWRSDGPSVCRRRGGAPALFVNVRCIRALPCRTSHRFCAVVCFSTSACRARQREATHLCT